MKDAASSKVVVRRLNSYGHTERRDRKDLLQKVKVSKWLAYGEEVERRGAGATV